MSIESTYERGRWEAIKEAAAYLESFGGPAAACARMILEHEAKLKRERASLEER